jgi:hypothetical protein
VHSRRAVPTHRSAYAFARGACGGVLTTSTPSSARTMSNAVVYLVSRSRIRNRNDPPAIPGRSRGYGRMGDPRPARMPRHATHTPAAGGYLNAEEHVHLAQPQSGPRAPA